MNSQEISKLTPSSFVTARPDLVTAAMDDKLVMLDLGQGKYFGLDDIGTVIWHYIAQPVSVGTLCQHLMTLYDVDEATCVADTLEFLNTLLGEGLLEIYESNNA